MSILYAVEPELHICKLPEESPRGKHGVGTIWGCDECANQAVVSKSGKELVWKWLEPKDYYGISKNN